MGRFISTYFMPRLSRIELRRKVSCSVSRRLSLSSPGQAMSTASEKRTFSTSTSPLEMSVPPEETMSKMPSAMPTAGAISTEPSMVWISASIPFSAK